MVTRPPPPPGTSAPSALIIRHLEEVFGPHGAPEAAIVRLSRQDQWPDVLPRLSDLSESIRPPQSFMYLREDLQVRLDSLTRAPSRRLRAPRVPNLGRRVSTRVLVGVTD